jgi:GNAT superfamily N-acetyltransferase
VETLTHSDHDAIVDLLRVASPSHWAPPGHPRVTRWWGVRDTSGTIIACVCDAPEPATGIPHLASVATAPSHRGRGLARDLVARAARDLLGEGASFVSLGSYAGNDAAGRVYRDLGFEIRHQWQSGHLIGGPAGAAPTPSDIGAPHHDRPTATPHH